VRVKGGRAAGVALRDGTEIEAAASQPASIRSSSI